MKSTPKPCPTWLSWMIEMDNPFCPVHKAANIVKNADVQAGMRVLDAGCGPGRITIPLARKVGPQGHVTALDIQAGMLARVKEKAEAADLTNITFLQAGLGEKKLKPNTFDRIFLVTVLGEIPNQEAALKEILSALKPNGTLSITEIIFDPHFQRRSSVRQLATQIGFQEKQSFGNFFAYTLTFTK